jgi:sugar lactone lactonase YvrE
MKTLLTPIAALAVAAGLAGAATAAPVVPGFSVTTYATAPAPVRLTFDATGVMYVGNGSNSLAGAPISRVAVGGGVATPYGPAIFDPDAVLYDALGTVSGVPGTVLVGGASLAGSSAEITVIRPDQTAFSLFGTSTALRNPDDLAFDNSGRLLGTDNGDGEPSRRTVFASTGGAPSLLFLESGGATPGSLAVDASNRIFTSASDGTIRIHDAAGNLVDGAFASGLGSFPAIGFGLGGPFGLNLYGLDYVAGTLLRFDSAGGTTVVGSGFSPDSYEMAFGPDGALYVALFEQNTVLRIAAVPEPGSLLLMALGGAALLLRARVRRSA